MGDKSISTVQPQTTDDQFDLALRATQALANLHGRWVTGAAALVNGAAGATGAGQVLAANASRKVYWLQNRGTNTLTVTLGATSLQLKAATVAGDGTGGMWIDEMWKGAVSVSGTSLSYNYGEV